MDFDYINESAKKFRLSIERDAFMEGVRLGFQLASERYLGYLSEFEKRRANSVIVINNNADCHSERSEESVNITLKT